MTPQQVYRTGDHLLLLSVTNNMANQNGIDYRQAVSAGIRKKVEAGIFPQRVPIGYRNNLLLHTIEKDLECFDTIRRAWDLMQTGGYTVSQALTVLNDEWGFRSKRYGKPGNLPLSQSAG